MQNLPFYYGYIIIVIASLGVIASIPGQTMGVSVFTDYYIEALGISRVALSSAYMAGTLISSLVVPFVGMFYDRRGPRVTAGIAAAVLGSFVLMFSYSTQILSALSSFIPLERSLLAVLFMTVGFFGIRVTGQGALTMVSRATLSHWFSAHRGLAAGILGVVTSFSFSYAPRALQSLIDSFGYAGALTMLAFLILLLFLPLALLLFRTDPASCGLEMEQGIRKKESGRRRETDAQQELTASEVRRQPLYWVILGMLGFWGLYNTAVTFHIISLFGELGATPSEAVAIFFPIAMISVVARFIGSSASDRIQLTHLYRIYGIASIGASLSLFYLDTQWGLYLMILCFGIAGGFFGMLLTVTFPKIYGMKHLGAITGLAMSVVVASSAVGPWLFSIVFAATGSYQMTGIGGVILTSLLFIALLTMKFPPHNRLIQE